MGIVFQCSTEGTGALMFCSYDIHSELSLVIVVTMSVCNNDPVTVVENEFGGGGGGGRWLSASQIWQTSIYTLFSG